MVVPFQGQSFIEVLTQVEEARLTDFYRRIYCALQTTFNAARYYVIIYCSSRLHSLFSFVIRATSCPDDTWRHRQLTSPTPFLLLPALAFARRALLLVLNYRALGGTPFSHHIPCCPSKKLMR